MFGFLKKKLQDAIGSFTKKAEKEAVVVEEPDKKAEEKKKNGKAAGIDFSLEKKPEKKTKIIEQVKDEAQLHKADKSKKEHSEHKDSNSSNTADAVKASETKGIEIKQELKHDEKRETRHDPKEKKREVQKVASAKHHDQSVEDAKILGKSRLPEKDETKPVINIEETNPETTKEISESGKKEGKKGFFHKIFGKKEEPGKKLEEKTKPASIAKEKTSSHDEIIEEKPKGIFSQLSDTITKVSLSESKFEEIYWDLEVSLLENNVAVEVIEKIKADLRDELVDKKLPRNGLDAKIFEALKRSIAGLFDVEEIDLIDRVRSKKPYIIVMIGINGTGKTTTVAKLVNLFKKNNLECVVAACDTFRAAAIQQLEEHTNKLGVKLIKHDYGADPAAVAFDAVEHAKAKGKDIVLIDTAGRLHSNVNLMAELEKVIRIAKPDMKIFIGESIAGNDVVEQVKLFNEKVGIDGIILSKADIDEKGGAAISVSYITGKPIMYLGMGQNYDDLVAFDKDRIISQIGLD